MWLFCAGFLKKSLTNVYNFFNLLKGFRKGFRNRLSLVSKSKLGWVRSVFAKFLSDIKLTVFLKDIYWNTCQPGINDLWIISLTYVLIQPAFHVD